MNKRIQVGDKVRHWFAGRGTVLSVNGRLARVQWASGGSGIAFVNELGCFKAELRNIHEGRT